MNTLWKIETWASLMNLDLDSDCLFITCPVSCIPWNRFSYNDWWHKEHTYRVTVRTKRRVKQACQVDRGAGRQSSRWQELQDWLHSYRQDGFLWLVCDEDTSKGKNCIIAYCQLRQHHFESTFAHLFFPFFTNFQTLSLLQACASFDTWHHLL